MTNESPPPAKPALVEDAAVRRLLRWLPFAMAGHLLVGVPAVLISLVVAYGTYVQARTSQRMQQVATWPFVEYDTSNYDAEGQHRISLRLTNNGVGPALLGPIEIRYRGRAMHDPQELLRACCGYDGGSVRIKTAPPSNVALRPGEQVSFFELPDGPYNRGMVDQLDDERWKLRVRACYCSIFDDCWTIDGTQAKPQPVAQCPADWVRYRER